MNAEQLSFNFDDYKSKPLCEVAKDLRGLEVEKLSILLIEWQKLCKKFQRDNIKLQLENHELSRKLSMIKKDETT